MKYVIDVKNQNLIEELEKCFKSGPIKKNGTHLLLEKTIAYLSGLKIQIFSDEHPPPHFRIIDGAGNANDFTITECKPMHGNSLSKYYRNIKNGMKKTD